MGVPDPASLPGRSESLMVQQRARELEEKASYLRVKGGADLDSTERFMLKLQEDICDALADLAGQVAKL